MRGPPYNTCPLTIIRFQGQLWSNFGPIFNESNTLSVKFPGTYHVLGTANWIVSCLCSTRVTQQTDKYRDQTLACLIIQSNYFLNINVWKVIHKIINKLSIMCLEKWHDIIVTSSYEIFTHNTCTRLKIWCIVLVLQFRSPHEHK